ncbi:HAD-IC family P-type ATPase [Clostridium sp. UBA6640]|uniref:HAD-IC family P-type ATPase n=1 Tax=Clostridium sp. UBA6640 TaxID=1946370 RepID=UPI0025BD8242|nr:HAD-IC family P-type ATPase [Clostridium sp. UBA6640]
MRSEFIYENKSYKALKSNDVNYGLTDKEVKDRVKKGKVNIIPKTPSRTIWQIIRANLFTSFNALNAVLAIIVIAAGSPKNALFAGVIISNTMIGVIQEVRAKAIIEKLSLLNMTNVKVMRDGVEKEISMEDLVIDDIMVLNPGAKIAADAEILYGSEIEVDESLLTGESDPVLKKYSSKILSGSFVVAGNGYAKVTSVGADTYSAKLAEEAKRYKLINSELQIAVNKIFKVIIWIVIPIGILLVATQLFFADRSWQDAVIGASSGIIGMVPEGFVLLTSATFIVAVIRLSKWDTLVQELPATEVLARVDVLCLDKTGTITEGRLKVADIMPLENSNINDIEEILAGIVHGSPSINPTQQAILEKYKDKPELKIKNKIPFSSEKKWSGVEFEEKGAWVLGAPEMILNDEYEEIKSMVEGEAIKGRRVLLLAKTSEDEFKNQTLNDVEKTALILIEDIIREEATKSFQYFEEEGVELKIISGDNPVTVSAVAKKAGIKSADKYVDARTLPEDSEQLAEIIENNTIFGRVTPHQKKEIVKSLQLKGHIVAMTGDGVNDVLALKEADCGIAMANGSDATKAVAQLVLLNSDFSALPKVVVEGRRLINNLEKVSELFLSKTVCSIILSFIFGLILLPFPFMPIQFSLIGSVAIGIPSFFLALAPNKERVNRGFLKRVLQVAIPNGIVTGLSTLVIFLLGYFNNLTIEQCRTLSILVLGGISLVVLLKVAKPLNAFKALLVMVMAILFSAAFVIPQARELFMFYNTDKIYTFISILLIILSVPFIHMITNITKKIFK